MINCTNVRLRPHRQVGEKPCVWTADTEIIRHQFRHWRRFSPLSNRTNGRLRPHRQVGEKLDAKRTDEGEGWGRMHEIERARIVSPPHQSLRDSPSSSEMNSSTLLCKVGFSPTSWGRSLMFVQRLIFFSPSIRVQFISILQRGNSIRASP